MRILMNLIEFGKNELEQGFSLFPSTYRSEKSL